MNKTMLNESPDLWELSTTKKSYVTYTGMKQKGTTVFVECEVASVNVRPAEGKN